ncbi:MAG: DUF2156 domain-containing protein [Schwartzia sp.]|nr:DUF2156 domain-containing protein [Schwartzia sp. (in: firmicutes)]
MLEWHSSDSALPLLFHGAQTLGNDTSTVNLYLLCDKYRTEVAAADGVLFRYYRGDAENRQGYGFPIAAHGFDGEKALALLRLDAEKRNVPLAFCLCDERQTKVLDELCKIHWRSFEGDSDYIYKRESLAQLSGKKLHAKKNLVNRFWRLHPDAEYRAIAKENMADALLVAETWFAEREDDADKRELFHIRKAAEHWDALQLFGGVLYVEGAPAAMTMASAVSSQCADVHFEKAIGAVAADGAFAAINQAFAASEAALPYAYINREEDMGVPGLRQVKEAYRPAFKVEKYYGTATES